MNKQDVSKITPKAFTFLLFCLGSFCVSCVNKNTFRSVELHYKIEVFNIQENRIVSVMDSILVVENNGIFLYRIARPYENTRVEMDSAGDIKNEVLLKEGTRYSYFFQEKDKLNGWLFDSMDLGSYRSANADTFLRSKLYFDSEMFYGSNDSLLSVSKEGALVVEKYIPKVKPDESFPDSSTLIFSDEGEYPINYSLSPKLDSIRKMKLQKAVFIYNGKQAGKEVNYFVPRREYVFELKNKENLVTGELKYFFCKVRDFIKANRETNSSK